MATFRALYLRQFCGMLRRPVGPLAAVGMLAMVVTGVVPLAAQPMRPFRLSRIAPLPLPRHPLARAEKDFPFFKHQPIATAGFNAVFLPFHHVFQQPSHGFNQAQAFAFLFSMDLDWAPGNYCNRHAYFLYNRSGANMVRLLRHYSRSAIARYFPGWEATVAVGGTLKHGPGGYTAAIVLFNRTGRLIDTMRYTTPMSFWNLLGAVDAGFMTYMKEPPSPALAHYLCQPRCNNMQCLTELGKAAFLPIQSTRAFTLFRKVLRIDPRFAEVRYWFENQAMWRGTHGFGKLESEFAQSLKNRLLPFPASIFDPAACHNKQLGQVLAKLEPAILAESKKLAGADSPLVLTEELNWETYKQWEVGALLREATRVAGKYPNDYDLLMETADLYANRKFAMDDNADMAAAIDAVALRDRWLTGQLRKHKARRDLGFSAFQTGHFGVAASLLLRSKYSHNKAAGLWALAQLGQFHLITRLSPKLLAGQPAMTDQIVAIYAFAAAMRSDRPELESIVRTYRGDLQQQGILGVMKYCLLRLAGKNTSHVVFNKLVPKWPGQYINIYIQAEYDLSRHQEVHNDALNNLFVAEPLDRLTWFYTDAYTRQEPHPYPDDPDFYNMLPWIFPQDPWARQAVRNYLARTKAHPVQPMNPQFVFSQFAVLKAYKHRESSQGAFNLAVFHLQLPNNIQLFNEMAAVHQFVQKSEFKRASRMAHVLEWYAELHDFASITHFFRHIVYMEKAAEMQAKKLPQK